MKIYPTQNITFSASFTDAPGGSVVDPTSVSVQIENNGTLVAGPFSPTREDVGLYEYTWTVPAGTPSGDLYIKWTAVIAGATKVGYEQFTVSDVAVSGVTTEDVTDATGVSVTNAQVAAALGVVELYASVDMSNFAAFGARDRKWLQAAVIYQAAWMSSQPNYMGRSDFTAMSQDGLSLSTRDQNTLALAPLARKALSRVSWVRPRSVRVRPGPQSRVGGFMSGIGGTTYPVGVPITDAMVDS